MSDPTAKPLAGIRVVEFGHYIAAPLAGMLLADQGADVTRIERPSGPPLDVPANATWNRGKRTLTCDLETANGRQIAIDLVRRADVLIENFRPGVMDRLRLGPQAMRALEPRLVYCSLPGFPSDDPRAAVPGYDGVIEAAMAAFRPWFEGARESDRPAFTALPVPSTFAALHAANAIALALFEREASGLGQQIELSLLAATYTALGALGLRIHRTQSGPNQSLHFVPLVRQYQCADGRWVQIHAFNSRFLRQFARAAGVEHWMTEKVLDLAAVIRDRAVADELQHRMESLFRTRPAQEWEDLLSTAGLCAAVCRTSAEWLRHPHAHASGAVLEVETPEYGRMLQPGPHVRVVTASETEPRPSGSGSRRETASAAIAPMARPPSPSAPAAGPLQGMRVLDLCIVFAGPTCARTLAEFGADVIKIDDPRREGGVIFHQDVNRGKRSILLDLRSDEGKAVFWRLLEDADVVVENFRKGAVERLGIGYDQVRARRPDIVYASLNAYGYEGPWAERPGWEQLAQAATGMQLRYGGAGPPVLQPFAVLDFGTGLSAAYGVALALLERRRTGLGQRVTTCLAATAGVMQSLFLQDYAGKVWGTEPHGQDALGFGPLHRLYRASDGWFFLAAQPAQLPAVAEIVGLDPYSVPGDGALAASLEERFALRPAAHWVDALQTASIGAHALHSIEEVMADPWARREGLAITREAPGIGLLDTIGPVARMSLSTTTPGLPAGLPGSDTVAILTDAGYAEREIEHLFAANVIAVPRAPR